MNWIPDIAGRWRFVLPKLMPAHTYLMSNIEDYGKNNEDCCLEMFSRWCDLCPYRTWNDLIQALKSKPVGKTTVADEIIQCLGKY